MDASEKFSGLFEHNSGHLGEFRYSESPEVEGGGNRGYSLAYYDNPEYGVTSVLTNGLRFQPVAALLPEEIVCTLHTGQEGFARHLVTIVADLILRNGRGIEYDAILNNATPLISETNIYGVIGYPSPYFGSEFDLFRDPEGMPVLQNVTLLPVTADEVEFAADNSPDALWEEWKANRIDLLDINRPSVV